MSIERLYTAVQAQRAWIDRAACRGASNPDVFFPGRGDSDRDALAYCDVCPVRDECLEYALVACERHGIWGGTSERERRRLRRKVAGRTEIADPAGTRVTVTKARKAKGKCDVLFSKIIRSRGACEDCGSTTTLQTGHVISRRYAWTRVVEDNAFCLCVRCHRYFTDHPVDFAHFVEEKIGLDRYHSLRTLALERSKFDWDAELVRLQARWKEIQ